MKRLNFILLNGAMGSGKSTIADLLKNKLKRTAIIEIEDVRHLVTGSEDNLLAWDVIYSMCDQYLKSGVNILLKQTVASQEIVNKFLRLARKHKCSIYFYHLQAPKNELLKRIDKRKKTKNVKKSLISSNLEKHKKISYTGATVINTSKISAADAANFIFRNLRS